jgi:hypothetical protein
MRFQISDGKRQFSRVSVMRSDDFGQEGKIDQPEKYMRRIKGPKLERRANHSTLRQNCTYKGAVGHRFVRQGLRVES